MTAKTTIEWTDKTWNPVRGCSLVSAGCTNCYAMKQAHRFSGAGQPFEGLTKLGPNGPLWTGKVTLVEKDLDAPLHWKKPARVFVNSMSDLFHEGVPDSFIDRMFAVMALCPQHTFQVLTKRPERMREYLTTKWVGARIDEATTEFGGTGGVFFNALKQIHLGVSVEDQATADARIPALLATPAAVRFISAEPLLGAVDLKSIHWPDELWPRRESEKDVYASALVEHRIAGVPKLDWVIVGGESGPGARPMHPDWVRSLRDQCVAEHGGAGVPFFFEQWGGWRECVTEVVAENPSHLVYSADEAFEFPEGHYKVMGADGDIQYAKLGKKRAGRVLDGRCWDQRPGEVGG